MTNETAIHSGTSLDDFLEEQGIREEVESAAIKRVLAWQFEQEMTRQRKTKKEMATELRTSRSQLDRLLDPQNTAISLDTIACAAQVLGKRLVFEIRDYRPAASPGGRAVSGGKGQKAEVVGRGHSGRGRGSVKGPIRDAKGVSGS